MKKADVKIGGRYHAKVSNEIAIVRVTGVNPYGGWTAVNEKTQRQVRIRSAQRLRGEACHRSVTVHC